MKHLKALGRYMVQDIKDLYREIMGFVKLCGNILNWALGAAIIIALLVYVPPVGIIVVVLAIWGFLSQPYHEDEE